MTDTEFDEWVESLWDLPDPEPHLATPAEACREYAANYGMDNPDVAWVATPWDTWESNPHYHGPAVPHPEAWDGEDGYQEQEPDILIDIPDPFGDVPF